MPIPIQAHPDARRLSLPRRGVVVCLLSLAFAPGRAASAQEPAPRTLREFYRAARASNETVLRAAEGVVQARAARRGSVGAILPRLTFEDNYFRQNRVELGGSPGVTATTNDRRNEVLLRLEQPLFHGLGEIAVLRSADATVAASEAELVDSRRRLFARVAVAFYMVLGREAQVRTLADSVSVQQERLREIQARREVGLARRTEVLLADSELVADEAALVGARNGVAIAREELRFLCGDLVAGALSDDLEVPALPSEDSVVEMARAVTRPDLVAALRRVDAAAHEIGAARAELLPALDLDALWVIDRDGYSTFASETDWTAQLEFKLPLFDGGRARAGIAAARSRLREAELAHSEIARRILLEARSARLALASSLAQRDQLERAAVSADESYRLAAEEYRGGLATNLEVIAAQNRLLASRLDLERQRYQMKVDWLALEIALGRRPAVEDEP